MDDECIHLLEPSTCTLCNGSAKRDRTIDYVFTAQFNSHCSWCGEMVYEGESIACTLTGSYGHPSCFIQPPPKTIKIKNDGDSRSL
jgi:hypothetical protein